MPPESRSIADEGVLIGTILVMVETKAGFFWRRRGLPPEVWDKARIRTRKPGRNLSEVCAPSWPPAPAGRSCWQRGRRNTGQTWSPPICATSSPIAEESVRCLLDRLDDGEFAYPMDNGAVVKVAIRVDRRGPARRCSTSRTSDQLPGNFNAPRAITRAAALYVLRTLIDDAIPMNDGCFAARNADHPRRLDAQSPARGGGGGGQCRDQSGRHRCAVRSNGPPRPEPGNDEQLYLRQREPPILRNDLRRIRAPGRIMTAPARCRPNMTNSRLTDPEILETRLPVRLDEFSIRRGSGGEGRHRGGDGVMRRVTFL